ncbi:HAD family hydrolase [Williamsia sp. 1135]|uniref:HAD family hydrolase n=1 Tax=Williamsia sp. 1135 TaxID=1889262 RepID=UPI000A105B5E|nr:HAD family hydrolase [Williamsia sp. 1135]ORM31899.1 HAD family hydrolase [Williamsia sp. 1135]
MTEIRWATFDCYGTLIDWRHGIATGIELIFPGRGPELLETFNRHEPVVQAETPTLRYRDVLTESFRRTADEAGLTLLPDDADVLAASIPYWPAFDDTAAELQRLRDAGWRLALLTNCDRDIIGAAQRRLRTPVDAIVTAEDVGAYKPDHRHFRRFAETFDPRPGNWVHVAQSYFHDMVPAAALGIPRVWVNRRAENDDPAIVDAVVADLSRLTETVTEVGDAAQRSSTI